MMVKALASYSRTGFLEGLSCPQEAQQQVGGGKGDGFFMSCNIWVMGLWYGGGKF